MFRVGRYAIQRPTFHALVGVLAGCILLAFGVHLAWQEAKTSRNLPASRNWPDTSGTITAGPHIESSGRRSGSYTLRIRYEYMVEGRGYTGRHVWVDGSGAEKGVLEEIASRLRAEPHVRVYYDPRDPARAVLIPAATGGAPPWDFGSVVVLGLLFVAGSYAIVTSVRRERMIYRVRR